MEGGGAEVYDGGTDEETGSSGVWSSDLSAKWIARAHRCLGGKAG